MPQTTTRNPLQYLLNEMNDHLGDIGYDLATIAVSDDPVEARVRQVEAFAKGLRDRIVTGPPGYTPNTVDDNSLEHGGSSGWNR